jgi:hypothetical protein
LGDKVLIFRFRLSTPPPLGDFHQPVRIYQRRLPPPGFTPPPPPSPSPPVSQSPPGTPTPLPPPPAARVETPVYHPPLLHRDPRHVHPMVTRHAAGTLCPRVLAAMTGDSQVSLVPSSVCTAQLDPHWCWAMEKEYAALVANQTWDLVPRPPGTNVVTGKWIWMHKRRTDGTLERYKARWVLRGFTQRPRVDYDETFSPVVKPTTVRTVLSLALARSWPVHQLDVKNAFLHGALTETVYCCQPTGFVDSSHPDMVCRLNRSLYGLKQAPRAWHSRLATYLVTLGFMEAKSDTSLFVHHHGAETAYLLLYVDDIVLTASSQSLLRRLVDALQREFPVKDLGVLHHFLGVTAEPRPSGLLLHQRQYTLDILEQAKMIDYKPCSTPVDTQAKLSKDMGDPVEDPTGYRSLTGALQYLTFTRLDISYVVQQICLHMHDPREPHLAALKRLLRSGAPSTTGCFSTGLPPPSWSSTPTLTGPGARTLGAPPPASPSSSAATWCPGRRSASRSSPARVLRRSTVLWPTAWRRLRGSGSSSPSSTVPSPGARWSTATTSASSTSPPTRCSTSGPSM